jgi:hypothetical protein
MMNHIPLVDVIAIGIQTLILTRILVPLGGSRLMERERERDGHRERLVGRGIMGSRRFCEGSWVELDKVQQGPTRSDEGR